MPSSSLTHNAAPKTRRISDLRKRLAIASAIAAATSAVAFGFGKLDAAPAIVVTLAACVAFVAWALPSLGVRALDRLVLSVRSFLWRREHGRHHAFAGIALDIVDDGRHVWVDGSGLQRVLGTSDRDDVLAARHAGCWRRDDEGRLMLRVDAVVDRLAAAPGRLDPRIVRLRRYFEREVLFPAAERRRRPQRAS
jgi:hypothetical protein